jgi:hypothetical protein
VITVFVVVVAAAAAAATHASAAVVTTAVNLDSWQAVRTPWMAIAVEEKN